MTSLDHDNNLCFVTLFSPSPSADLAKLQSKLEALRKVEKLCEFLTNSKNQQNDPKNLLDNLCDGLETFLGFNSESKGYDGKGIVYSDLDRLCDGVMGFLSGVLSNIKEHLGQHKDEINNAIDSLKQNKHAGKNGFNNAIGKVVAGVRGYNKEVKKSNAQVIKIVTDLQDYTKNNGRLLNDIYNIQVDDESKDKGFEKAKTQVEERLQECRQKAETFTNDLDANLDSNKHRYAINDLDDKLRDKLENIRATVVYESSRLSKVKELEAEKFTDMTAKIKSVLDDLRCNVDSKIGEQVKNVCKRLTVLVKEILHLLENINSRLQAYVADLGQWIDNANAIIHTVDKKIEIILQEANGSNRNQIETAATLIVAQTEVVSSAVEEARKKVKDLVDSAKLGVDELKHALGRDLLSVKNRIKKEMKNLVLKAFCEYEEIKKRLQIGNDKSIEFNWDKLKWHVQRLALDINSTGFNTSGLRGIKKGVADYAAKFSNGITFASIVQGWIRIILQGAIVNEKLALYANESNGAMFQYGFSEYTIDQIATVIKNNLNGIMIDAIASFQQGDIPTSDGTENGITTNIDAIKRVCKKFADGLQGAIGTTEQTSNIVSNIDEQLRRNKIIPITNRVNNNLTEVVRTTLMSLQSTAKENMNHMNKLIEQCHIGNVNAAIESVDAIDKQFNNDDDLQEDYGYKIGEALKEVNDKITKLGSALKIADFESIIEDQLPDVDKGDLSLGLGSPIKFDNLTISFKKGGLVGAGKSKKEELNEAIMAIHTEVTNALQPIDQAYANLMVHASDVNSYLTSLCHAIKQAAGDQNPDGLKTKLKDLKNLINNDSTVGSKGKKQKGLSKIHSDLSELRSSLMNDPIKKVTELLTFITRLEDQTIRMLKHEVENEVKRATDKLTTHARKTYVESIKFLLAEFANKVTSELSELPTLIEHDQHIGLKGFMEVFNGGDSGYNVNRLLSNSDIPTLCRGVETFFAPLKSYIDSEINRLDEEEREKHPSLPRSQDPYTSKLAKLYAAISGLISHVYAQNKYDSDLPTKLDDLTAAVADLTTDGFPNPVTAMLQGVSGGCRELVGALGKVYISRYDGANPIQSWITKVADKTAKPNKDGTPTEKEELTFKGRNGAKVFLTCTSTLFNELYHLFQHCTSEWKKCNIKGEKNGDALQKYLTTQGFQIESLITSTTALGVTGKLFNGFNAYGEFNKHPKDFSTFDDCVEHFRKHEGPVAKLFYYLHQYYRVCHLASFNATRHPSSIYDILQWLTGLPYNSVYPHMSLGGFSDLFEKKDKDAADSENDISLEDEDADTLEASPSNVTAAGLSETLVKVCHDAEEVLLSILGHGHADGIYACDFNTNPQGFQYPTNMDTLVCMLCEVVNRLYNQLYFLLDQCKRSTLMSGWRECEYGQGVGGSGWRCNDLRCGDCNSAEKCKRHPKCGVKSPLQSYLEDGLRGFLPHNLDGNSGKLNCPVKSHTNGPCKTPMGFKDINIMASHRHTGRHIGNVLAEFCGTASSPLTKLCSMLRCVLPSAPKTFDQLFAFYYSLLVDWDDQKNKSRITHREQAFNSAVIAANFENPSTQLEIAPMFGTTSHKFGKHPDGALYSLLSCNPGSRSSHACGPYMKPICSDVSTTFTVKHADRYLSSVLYLTESFYHVLQQLFEECNSKCGKTGTRCSTKSCAKGCERQQTKKRSADPSHKYACTSVVNCESTLPILYKYGFIFNDAESLNGAKRINTKRTCVEFCKTLENVVKEGSVLYNLVHKTIPEFLFTIRQPFIWLNVALWSLSLFYLICVMIGRLDVLHISSHLRIPSSHKITAQSLLAAAQVGRLAKISYLQP